ICITGQCYGSRGWRHYRRSLWKNCRIFCPGYSDAADRFADGRRGLHELLRCAEWTALRHAETGEGRRRCDHQLRCVHERLSRFSDCGVGHIPAGPSAQSHEEGDSSSTSIGEGVSTMHDVDSRESQEMRTLRDAVDSRMIRLNLKTEPIMFVKSSLLAIVMIFLILAAAPSGFAQVTGAFPRLYTGSFGGGLALTGGNTDTKNFSLSFDMFRDPLKKSVVKLKSSYLRGAQNKTTNLDRASVALRDEYTLSGRVFAFGQLDYLRDRFKSIVFIWNPSGGLGYKIFNSDKTKLQGSGGAGGILEKDTGLESTKSGSVIAGDTFRYKLSNGASL